nr:unnamed protein product [Callosobruchus analis]
MFPDGVCVAFNFTSGGGIGTVRSCLQSDATCDKVKKSLDTLNIHVTDCKICKDDLCNGD